MPQIDLYGTTSCPYCMMARRLLQQKGVDYNEIPVDTQPHKRAEMVRRSNGVHSVPQIFIGERHVGGCNELYALEANGELNHLLQAMDKSL